MSNDEEEKLVERRVWSSKDVWKLVSGVAVGVFVITLIYARFLSMEISIVNQKALHDKDIVTLQQAHQKDMENLQILLEAKITVLDERQGNQHGRQDEEIKVLQNSSHEAGK